MTNTQGSIFIPRAAHVYRPSSASVVARSIDFFASHLARTHQRVSARSSPSWSWSRLVSPRVASICDAAVADARNQRVTGRCAAAAAWERVLDTIRAVQFMFMLQIAYTSRIYIPRTTQLLAEKQDTDRARKAKRAASIHTLRANNSLLYMNWQSYIYIECGRIRCDMLNGKIFEVLHKSICDYEWVFIVWPQKTHPQSYDAILVK